MPFTNKGKARPHGKEEKREKKEVPLLSSSSFPWSPPCPEEFHPGSLDCHTLR